MMRRREFMALAGSLAAWPMTTRAQKPKKVARITAVRLSRQ